MRRVFLRLLLVELCVVGIVVLIFKLVEDRRTAGVMAGSLFVTLGLWIFFEGLRDRGFRRSLTFYAGAVHLFVGSLPVLLTRLLFSGEHFINLKILGFSGPTFHRVSTVIYLGLILFTIFDFVREWRRNPARQP
jgi:hypothetical protein